MTEPAPPVILLAFARSEDPRFQGLPRLPEEARLLREALDPAEAAGQIKLEIRQDATLDDILRAFDRYRNRVAIFHFAGHTDDQSLLAEKLLGAEALLAAVHAQSELKLVFLNACENLAQAAGLHAAGVPAAIVTSEEVDDDLCLSFAMRFYRALAGGFTLAEAFAKARLAAEGEAYDQSGVSGHGPWLLSTPDPAAGTWRLPRVRLKRSGLIPLQKPIRVQHFTGREQELARLLEDLQPGKTVTLCGPGGMGKSALAAEAVWTLAPGDYPPDRFPDGIVFHTFYHQPQATLALEAIARAYGVDQRPSPRDAALHALAGKTALLVLDGAEEADDLPAVLSVASSCSVLITTRQHEDAPDDFQDIEPLPRAESLHLLRSWARKYAADDQSANEIVRLLGGLPLALFLAGRYMAQRRQHSSEYAAWLKEEGLEALHFGERPTLSIPLLLQQSLAQVSGQALAAFGVAGILALAPFVADAVATALHMNRTRVNRALGELVSYGLLLRPDDSYQVTHALAHNYARTQVAPSAEIVDRLALYYSDLAATESAKGRTGYAVLDKDRFHIVAVQAAAFKAGQWSAVRQMAWNVRDYLDLKGYWTERVAILQAGLDAARMIGDRYDEGTLQTLLGNAYADLGETRNAIERYEQALVTLREIGDRRGEGKSLSSLGLAYARLGVTGRAIELFEQALAIDREIGDRGGEGANLGNLGNAYSRMGNSGRATELFGQQLMIAREINDRRGEGAALGNLGNAYVRLGDVRRAIELYEQQLLIAREMGHRRGEGSALGNLGVAYGDLGETRRAIEFHEQRLEIAREIGDRRGEGYSLSNLGLAYARLGELRRPIELFEQALVIDREIGDRRGEGADLGDLGKAHARAGETHRAIELFEQALVITREINDRRGEGTALGNLGNAYASLGAPRRAIELFEQQLMIAREIGHRRGEGNALGDLGIAYARLGEVRRAIELYEQRLEIAREIGDRRGQAFTSWNLGLAYELEGDFANAIANMQACVAYEQEIGHPDADAHAQRVADLNTRAAG